MDIRVDKDSEPSLTPTLSQGARESKAVLSTRVSIIPAAKPETAPKLHAGFTFASFPLPMRAAS
jgi:hypothetical protein